MWGREQGKVHVVSDSGTVLSLCKVQTDKDSLSLSLSLALFQIQNFRIDRHQRTEAYA